MTTVELEQRLQALEDIDAIRSLKAHYLACCDAKDPLGMRACFADGPVAIDYGVVGKFESAEPLVEIFKQIGCHPHMVEMHHGVNPRIKLLGPGKAEGLWGLHYQLINTNDNTLTQLGAYYEDAYVKTAAGWKISATKCVVTSTLVLKLGAEATAALVIGRVAAG
ncbi:MAG: nuclear transport factor 2 family protein [Stagnimonas sp.]|nr:nuclear transport factor 2 family protein [Stagnimonas sp.]